MAEEVENTGLSTESGISRAKLIEVNLLPAEFRTTHRSLEFLTDARVIIPTVLVVLFLVATALFYAHTQDTLSNLDTELNSIKKKVAQDKPLLDEIKKLNRELDIIAQKNKALKSIQVSKKVWVIMFEAISSVLPENMWLNSIKQNGSEIIELKGTTYRFNEIASYMVELKKLESFVKVELGTISSSKKSGSKMDLYQFTLKCFINKELGLETGR